MIRNKEIKFINKAKLMNFSHLSSPYFHSGLSQMIISNKIIKLSPESRYQSKNNSKLLYESPLTTSNSIFNESPIDDFLLPDLENNKKVSLNNIS